MILRQSAEEQSAACDGHARWPSTSHFYLTHRSDVNSIWLWPIINTEIVFTCGCVKAKAQDQSRKKIKELAWAARLIYYSSRPFLVPFPWTKERKRKSRTKIECWAFLPFFTIIGWGLPFSHLIAFGGHYMLSSRVGRQMCAVHSAPAAAAQCPAFCQSRQQSWLSAGQPID